VSFHPHASRYVMASPQPNGDARLSTHSKDTEGSTREKSPARLATDPTAMIEEADKNGSDYSGPSSVDAAPDAAAAAAAPVEDPAALAPPTAGAPLEKMPSKEVLERSMLQTAMLVFALCVRLDNSNDSGVRLTCADGCVPCGT
jgi:hypothetical protein